MKTNIKEARRSLFLLLFLIVLMVLLVSLRQYTLLPKLFDVLIKVSIAVLSAYVVFFIIYISLNKGIKQTIKKWQIISSVESGLISIGAYYEFYDEKVLPPNVKVNLKSQEITIWVCDLKIRSRVEANKDILSSTLPNDLIVYKTYLSKDENYLIIRFKDLSKNKRVIFEEQESYINWINQGKMTSIRLDGDNTIDLIENNGLLITGKSGSGKSFFAQQVLIQGIIKHWDISILDYKRSYQAFEEFCKVSYSVDEITKSLEDILSDLHERQKAMNEVLKANPQALAIDKGFPVKFVLIEEYLALVNSGADKKTLERIEKMILEITTTGRSLNVYLCMVLQVSSAQALNTSIRANLPIKIVFGNPERTIYETTFGKSSVPDIVSRMDKGEGLCSIDGDIVPFSSLYLKCNIKKILQMIK